MTVPMTNADLFAATGLKVQPPAPLLAAGYSNVEFPLAEHHNYLFNELGANILFILASLGGAANNNFAPLSGGSAANFTVAYPSPFTALTAGRVFFWRPDRNHSGAATIQVDGLPAADVKTPDPSGTLTDNNEFVQNDGVTVIYDGTDFVVSDFTPMTAAGGVVTGVTGPDGTVVVDATDPAIPALSVGAMVLRTDVKKTYQRPITQPFTPLAGSNIDGNVSSKIYKSITGATVIGITALGTLEDGQVVEMMLEQDATGGHAVTFSSDFVVAGNRASANNVSTSANAVSAIYGEFVASINKVVLV